MEETLFELLKNHFTGVLAVSSTLLGVIISQFFNLRSKRLEYGLRVSDKILEKRLKAHEEILQLSKLMRSITSKDEQKALETGRLETYPIIFNSKQAYVDFMTRFQEVVNRNSHLLSIDLFRKINFIQDYLVTFKLWFQFTVSDDYPEIGKIIKDDFIDFSKDLERDVMIFFEKGAYIPKYVGKVNEYHKFSEDKTGKMLNNTLLFKRKSYLDPFIKEFEI